MDVKEHPAAGIIIADLENRYKDVRVLLGLEPDSNLLRPVDVEQLIIAANSLVKMGSMLASSLWGDDAIEYLRSIIDVMPLMDGET